MTRPLRLSEKSLELNASAELIEFARKRDRHAYLIGMTQAQETATGTDVGVRSFGFLMAAFQFKAPWAPKLIAGRPKEYRFTIGGRQLQALKDLTSLVGPRVFYALPCANTTSELAAFVPNLCAETVALDPVLLGPGSHRVDVRGGVVTIHSAPLVIDRVSLRDALENPLHDPFGSPEAPAGDMIGEWLSSLRDLGSRQRGQLLRGLMVLGAPRVQETDS